MTFLDSTNDQNIVTTERVNILYSFTWVMQACKFTKSDFPPLVLFTFFKVIQTVPNRAKHLIYFKHERPFGEEKVMNK